MPGLLFTFPYLSSLVTTILFGLKTVMGAGRALGRHAGVFWVKWYLGRTSVGKRFGTGHEPFADVLTIFESLYACFFFFFYFSFLSTLLILIPRGAKERFFPFDDGRFATTKDGANRGWARTGARFQLGKKPNLMGGRSQPATLRDGGGCREEA